MLLEASGLHKSYGNQAVLRGVDLTLGAGESLALMGESGSGKSTLVHLLGGLDRPDQGEVRLNGAVLSDLGDGARAGLRRRDIGIVFQQFNLVPSMTAAANLGFQAALAGRVDRDWSAEIAERLGLRGHLGKFPEELSGGQQQRVAIGRALAARPQLVLADEPTGNLDEAMAEATLALFLEIVRDSGAGLVMATHSRDRAGALDRRLVLSRGQVA